MASGKTIMCPTYKIIMAQQHGNSAPVKASCLRFSIQKQNSINKKKIAYRKLSEKPIPASAPANKARLSVGFWPFQRIKRVIQYGTVNNKNKWSI